MAGIAGHNLVPLTVAVAGVLVDILVMAGLVALVTVTDLRVLVAAEAEEHLLKAAVIAAVLAAVVMRLTRRHHAGQVSSN